MAVKIRLTRIGKKRQPFYRVVVTDSRSPRDGRYIEQIGRYDPQQEPSLIEIDTDRAAYWLSNGAQPTSQAKKLLEIAGAVKARPVKGAPKPAKVHVVGEEAQKAAEAEDASVLAAARKLADDAEEAAKKVVDEVETTSEEAAETVDEVVAEAPAVEEEA